MTGPTGASIAQALQRLLDAGQAAGTIRSDVDARDVVLQLTFLSHLEEHEAPERAARGISVLFGGLLTGR